MNNCEICGEYVASQYPHHLITRGAFGGNAAADNPDNTIWLCARHHSEVHNIGRDTFFKKWGLEHRLEVAKAAFRIHNGGEA